MVRKRPNWSLPVLDIQGEGRTELRERPNGSDHYRSSAPAAVSVFSLCIFASSSSISDRVLTMVDILMLMFFAIMGLVFLSYIIYMLWSCCQPRRRLMRNPDDAPLLRHPWCSSWTVVGSALKLRRGFIGSTASICICTAPVVATWKCWCVAMIISKCFRPVVACWRSRDLAVMGSHWSFHSTRKERPRTTKWRKGGANPSPAHLHYHHSPSLRPFKC